MEEGQSRKYKFTLKEYKFRLIAEIARFNCDKKLSYKYGKKILDIIKADKTVQGFSKIKALILKGADINLSKNKVGSDISIIDNALIEAVKSNNFDVFWLLISSGADLKSYGAKGLSVAYYILNNTDTRFLKAFVDNVNYKDVIKLSKYGHSTMQSYAIKHMLIDNIKVLADKGFFDYFKDKTYTEIFIDTTKNKDNKLVVSCNPYKEVISELKKIKIHSLKDYKIVLSLLTKTKFLKNYILVNSDKKNKNKLSKNNLYTNSKVLIKSKSKNL